MSKGTKIWLIVAFSLALIGCIIFGGVLAVIKWDFSKLSTVKYETNDYEMHEDYKNISIVTATADVVFLPSESQKTSVVCHEQKNMKHAVSVKDEALVIEVIDTRKWYEYIGINFRAPKVTVYLPQGEYGSLTLKSDTGDIKIPREFKFKSIDISESTGNITNNASALEIIKIRTSTGNIKMEDLSVGALDLSVSTGKIVVSEVICEGDATVSVSTGKTYLTDVSCNSLLSSGNTGDISLKNVIASNKFTIKRSTGDVNFDSSDAAEIFVETDTGDISGNLLTDKVFIAETDTGSVDVPKTVVGGRCEIKTNTGNIMIKTKD